MADTKLTREWVEHHLQQWEGVAKASLDEGDSNLYSHYTKRAALCRHYLATEQLDEALRQARAWIAEAAENGCGLSARNILYTIDAALTQKESQT